MLKTSAAFAALLDTAPLRLHLTLADGTEIPRAAIRSAEWTGGSNAGDDITLGSTVAVQLKAELDRAKLGESILADMDLTATLTIDGADDTVPVARLRVDNVKADDDKLTVSACDAMVWAFGAEYALDDAALGFDWEAGVDGETLLRAICQERGVELAAADLPPIQLRYASPAGYTYREIIAFLGCMWGRFARVDAEGRLTLQWYANIWSDEGEVLGNEVRAVLDIGGVAISVAEAAENDGHTPPARSVGPGRYYDGELTLAAYEYTIGYLKCYAEPLEETLLAGDTTRAQGIYIKCPWMTQERLEAVWAAVGGFTYRPVTGLRFLGDPRLEPGDMILVTARDGQTSAVPCMTIRHEYDGGLITEISAAGKSESASEEDYMGPVTRRIERMKVEIDAGIVKFEDRIEGFVRDEVDGLSATVTVGLQNITAQVNGLDDAYAALSLEVGGVSTKVNGLDGQFSLLEQTVNGLVYTDDQGRVLIKNGSLNLTGAITWDDLDSGAQDKVKTATSNASTALSRANTAKNRVDSWTYGGTTLINGDMLATDTVRATKLQGGTVQLLDYNERQVGSMTLTWTSTGVGVELDATTGGMKLQANGNVFLQSGNGYGPSIQVDSNLDLVQVNGGPLVTGSQQTLGTASKLWGDVYSTNGSIQVSDREQKTDIEPLPEKYLALFDGIEPVRFRRVDGTSGRYHTGFIAQQVKEAMDAAGISSEELAAYIKDVDPDTKKDIYMLRYEELISILWSKVKEQETRLETMDQRLNKLEAMMDGR